MHPFLDGDLAGGGPPQPCRAIHFAEELFSDRFAQPLIPDKVNSLVGFAAVLGSVDTAVVEVVDLAGLEVELLSVEELERMTVSDHRQVETDLAHTLALVLEAHVFFVRAQAGLGPHGVEPEVGCLRPLVDHLGYMRELVGEPKLLASVVVVMVRRVIVGLAGSVLERPLQRLAVGLGPVGYMVSVDNMARGLRCHETSDLVLEELQKVFVHLEQPQAPQSTGLVKLAATNSVEQFIRLHSASTTFHGLSASSIASSMSSSSSSRRSRTALKRALTPRLKYAS